MSIEQIAMAVYVGIVYELELRGGQSIKAVYGTSQTLRCKLAASLRKRSCLASLLARVVRILSIHLYSGSSFITNSSTKLFT